MKLPPHTKQLEVWLSEFDHWITPALEETRNADKFKAALAAIVYTLDRLAGLTAKYTQPPLGFGQLMERYFNDARAQTPAERLQTLVSLISTLLLATAKSDNNVKCQFPLYLRDALGWSSYPKVNRPKGKSELRRDALPRTLPLDAVIRRIIALEDFPTDQLALLKAYTTFLVKDERDFQALWQLGQMYVQSTANDPSHPGAFLESLVTFQVRGSVAASGGHVPEQRLRRLMQDWGLTPAIDFNMVDVIVKDDGTTIETASIETVADQVLIAIGDPATVKLAPEKMKTRAFDFVLPYKVDQWKQRVFIQSQFYAGDSGSVSHKNVDQASISKKRTAEIIPNPLFVEYVDGAGYFSSLNGDLKKMFASSDTHAFLQVRSAPIRLRRLLQEIGFLCPLEIEHATAQTDGSDAQIKRKLLTDGYTSGEVERALAKALNSSLLSVEGEHYRLQPEREPLIRRYAILDTIARHGVPLPDLTQTGSYFVPGYGPFHGLQSIKLVDALCQDVPYFSAQFESTRTFLADLEILTSQGFVKST